MSSGPDGGLVAPVSSEMKRPLKSNVRAAGQNVMAHCKRLDEAPTRETGCFNSCLNSGSAFQFWRRLCCAFRNLVDTCAAPHLYVYSVEKLAAGIVKPASVLRWVALTVRIHRFGDHGEDLGTTRSRRIGG